ncbi:hypothetical protein BGZ99_000870 [Dissophora globulifera]|uniref:Uncharacterized protein n=1 Tax=Dissophora globulifera TaxID=979702 RepID=A0A9P6R3X7_9FUNG|nr:hypothetical protein BGZ99_000870 [Dissophora globulifera]
MHNPEESRHDETALPDCADETDLSDFGVETDLSDHGDETYLSDRGDETDQSGSGDLGNPERPANKRQAKRPVDENFADDRLTWKRLCGDVHSEMLMTTMKCMVTEPYHIEGCPMVIPQITLDLLRELLPVMNP